MNATPLPALLEGALRPLDVVRRETLIRAARLPWIGPALRTTETRSVALASAGVVVAFIMTSVAPGVLFVLGPLLLGVLHVGSDIRYLVLRQDVPRRWLIAVSSVSLALIAWRCFEIALPHALPFARGEVAIGWTWTIAGAWLGASAATDRKRWLRAVLATIPLIAVLALALSHPAAARALVAYGHNVVALVIWIALFRRHKLRAALPVALVAAGVAVLARGVTLGRFSLEGPWAMRLFAEVRGAAPGLEAPSAALVGLTYVFLQAVHYSVWLAWIPQEEVRGDATLTFRMSMRAAARDFGAAGLALLVAAALAVAGCSLVSVHRTRAVYLSLATFHAYLELACLAFFWTHGNASSLARSRGTR